MRKLVLLFSVSCLSVAAVAEPMMDQGKQVPMPTKASLYHRIGGVNKIAAFIDKCVTDESTRDTYMNNETYQAMRKGLTVAGLKFVATEEMIHALGGPNKYMGPTAAQVLTGLGFTPAQLREDQTRMMGFMTDLGISNDVQMDVASVYAKQFMSNKKPYSFQPETFKDKTSLYARLGGFVAISNVVDEFVNQLATDPTIGANSRVVKALTDGHITVPGLKILVTEQLCEASGGPFKYIGRSMADSHKGLMITDDEWTSGAKILKGVLDKFNVPSKEQDEIFTVIGGTKKDIVGK